MVIAYTTFLQWLQLTQLAGHRLLYLSIIARNRFFHLLNGRVFPGRFSPLYQMVGFLIVR